MRAPRSLLLPVAVLSLLLGWVIWNNFRDGDDGWQAGTAARNITPEEPMWMSGYASRDRPSEGQLTPLWAKALALQSPKEERGVLITLDLIGLDRDFSLRVRDRIQQRHGLTRSQVILSTSHTHTGPVVGSNLQPMYALSPEEQGKVERYTAELEETLVTLADDAIGAMGPVRMYQGEGEAYFAANRRNNAEADAVALREAGELRGPVDYSVPVLKVVDASEGAGPEPSIQAVVFGYACHATVLDSFQWSGDYPGFAQEALQERYPEALALFWAGCGADINPMPRREENLARDHGRALAEAVVEVIEGSEMRPLTGAFKSVYEEIPLSFAEVPSEEVLRERLTDENPYVVRTAAHLLQNPDLRQRVAEGYPYPVQTWSWADGPTWVTLGGEVVVDYALAIKEALGKGRPVWVAGYCHDVMAYIPSRRVLDEGGYEGGGAMIYYGLPGPWAGDVEERILAEVQRQERQLTQGSAAPPLAER